MRRELPQVGKSYRTALVPEIRAFDDESRTIEFVASTEATDRYGDVIRVAGWETENYEKNPVFLWAHRSGDPPIGKCVGLRKEAKPPALVQTIQFADKATYPFADTIFNLYKGGFLKAVSVGFMPLEMPTRITDAEGNATGGYEFTNQELLELSAVPVPANPEAVARAITKGFGTEADLRRVFSGEAPNVDRELAEISLAMSSLAVSLATATVRVSATRVREALAALRAAAARPEDSGELTFEELLAVVRRPRTSDSRGGDIDSVDALGSALESGDIDTLEELAAAVGSTDKPVGADEVFSDSRRWRTGKFSIPRELR